MADRHHPWCKCKHYCTDVPEDQDHPLSVCKALPVASRTPLVEVAVVDRREAVEGESNDG